MNPADYYLDLINVDFYLDRNDAEYRILKFSSNWNESDGKLKLDELVGKSEGDKGLVWFFKEKANSPFHQFAVLVSRNFKTAYKNVIQYWIRIAM